MKRCLPTTASGMAHCPFHQENTPSCALYPNTQNYYCFSCLPTEDSIDLVMKFANVDFKEAIEIIKGKVSIIIHF